MKKNGDNILKYFIFIQTIDDVTDTLSIHDISNHATKQYLILKTRQYKQIGNPLTLPALNSDEKDIDMKENDIKETQGNVDVAGH